MARLHVSECMISYEQWQMSPMASNALYGACTYTSHSASPYPSP